MSVFSRGRLGLAGRARGNGARGMTLVEVMFAVVILGIVSLGVGVGLQSTTRMAYATDTRMVTDALLIEKLELLRGVTYTALSGAVGVAHNSLCDTVTINGAVVPRTVSVAFFDADGNGSADADMVEVTVTIDGQYMKTRVCQP